MAAVDVAGKGLNITLVAHEGITWYDLRHPSTAEMAYLKEHFPSIRSTLKTPPAACSSPSSTSTAPTSS